MNVTAKNLLVKIKILSKIDIYSFGLKKYSQDSQFVKILFVELESQRLDVFYFVFYFVLSFGAGTLTQKTKKHLKSSKFIIN